jgi:predicted anti-sigma-YlaC factor YlaD
MRRPTRSGQLCDRAHEWASLRLDCELSELESALLDAHLARCAECRQFADAVDRVTDALRSAALEPLTAPVVLPRRRVRATTRTFQAVAASALVLVAAGLGSLFGILSSHGKAPSRAAGPHALVVAFDDTANSLRAIRRQSLIAGTRTIPRNRSLGEV